MVNNFLLSLTLGVLGLSLLLPCYAAPPTKIAGVAPIADVTAAVDASVKVLDEKLVSSDEYNQSKKPVAVEATIIAVLAQAVADSEEKAAWQGSANDVRAAAQVIVSAKTYDDAKKGLAALKEAQGGKASGAKAEDWNKLVPLGKIMDAVNSRAGKMRRSVRAKAPTDPQVAESTADATALAVLALAIHDDTHEVKSKKAEDIALWQTFSKDFQSQMSLAAASFKKKDLTAAADAWKKGNTACNDCHSKFREHE